MALIFADTCFFNFEYFFTVKLRNISQKELKTKNLFKILIDFCLYGNGRMHAKLQVNLTQKFLDRKRIAIFREIYLVFHNLLK